MFRTISDSPQNVPPKSSFSSERRTNTKITYDPTGKIVSSTYLLASDIPEIPIPKVSGLQAALDALTPSDPLPVGTLYDILYYNGSD